MNMVVAIIRSSKLDDVKEALTRSERPPQRTGARNEGEI